MACWLVGAKPLSEPMLEYGESSLEEQTSVKFNRNSYIFGEENVFENTVWKRWLSCLGFNVLNTGKKIASVS